jgi:hypothetical protein
LQKTLGITVENVTHDRLGEALRRALELSVRRPVPPQHVPQRLIEKWAGEVGRNNYSLRSTVTENDLPVIVLTVSALRMATGSDRDWGRPAAVRMLRAAIKEILQD